jgi:hypothetical protein
MTGKGRHGKPRQRKPRQRKPRRPESRRQEPRRPEPRRPEPRRRERRPARRLLLAAGAGLAITVAAAAALLAPGSHPAAPAIARTGGTSSGAAKTGVAGIAGAGTGGAIAGRAAPAQPGANRSGAHQAGTSQAGGGPGQPGLTGGGRAAGPGAALAFCPAAPTPVLRAALDRVVPGTGRAELEPLGVTGDGRGAYVSAWTPGFSGVAELSLATGALREIRAFAQPSTDQADGTASGHWLVWAQTYSLSSLDRFTMYAWNAVTGRLLRLGQSIAGRRGVPWPSPWHAPAVSGNYAAWAQGYGPGGLVEIRLANLVTGQVTTIRRGHVQPPLFDGGLVVWPESDAPGTQTALRAYRPASRRLVALPAALAAVHGTDFVAADGTRTAYLDPSLTRLYYSARPDQPARLALALPVGAEFGSLALAPGTLAWTTSRATYLASTRTGAFTQVTPEYGYATGSRSVMLVSDAPDGKAVHPPLPLHVISPAALSGPGCRAGG